MTKQMEIKLTATSDDIGVTAQSNGYITSEFLIHCIDTLIFVISRETGKTREQIYADIEFAHKHNVDYVDHINGKLN